MITDFINIIKKPVEAIEKNMEKVLRKDLLI